jgi:iron complex outermembrane receptor protein
MKIGRLTTGTIRGRSYGMSRMTIIVLGASVAIVSLHQPSLAQSPAAAAPTSSGTSGFDEIVVTARRREERLQSVPIAVTAFTQQEIEQNHIQSVLTLGNSVPSLATNQNNSDAYGFSSGQVRIRGLPGSVVYFADVPLGSTDFNQADANTHASGPGYYYDLDNLEVVKGPQGTLFGKNSIGGLISISPRKPTNDYEGYFSATFGNYSDRQFEGAVNVPVVADKLLVRVAGQSQQRDGYTKDIADGKDLDNRNYFAWRVGVTLRPSDDFENYLLYDGYWQDTNGGAIVPAYVNPDFILAKLGPSFMATPPAPGPCVATVTLGGPAFGPLGNVPGGCGMNRIGLFPTVGSVLAEQQALGPRAIAGTSIPTIGKDYFYGFTNTTRWDLSDDLTIKNIAAARVFKQLNASDEFGNPLPLLNIGYPLNNTGWSSNLVQYTEEFQLQGKSLNDKLTWVLGGFLEFDHPLGVGEVPTGAAGNTSYLFFHDSSRSQAVFAHGIYDLSDYVDGLRFTAGYRYTWDFTSVQEHGTSGGTTLIRDANGKPTNCGTAVFDNNCEAGSDANFSSYGWNLGLDEQLTPTTLIYVRSGNAYRPGGTNPVAPQGYQSIQPEHVTDVEIGAKVDWSLFGIQVRTDGDIFHTSYKSIQVSQLVTVTDEQGNVSANRVETNAAGATLEGAELAATIIPVTGVELSPHASYLYSHYDKYPSLGRGDTSSAPPFFYEPKWQYGVTATYHLPLDQSVGDIALTAIYSFNGHQYEAAAGGDILPILPSHDNLDVRVDWVNVFDNSVDASFFMTNALDKTYIQAAIPLYYQLGYTSVVYNEPRMFGFTLKYRFGGPAAEPEAPPVAYTPPAAQAVAPAPRSYLVFFDFNKSDLTPQAAEIVDQAAKNAGPAKVTRLTVTGHTDTVGSDAYNMRLSRRRAESVATQLEKDGIPSSEIDIVAKGKHDLLVPTADGVREPQNRRVQIVYSGEAAS